MNEHGRSSKSLPTSIEHVCVIDHIRGGQSPPHEWSFLECRCNSASIYSHRTIDRPHAGPLDDMHTVQTHVTSSSISVHLHTRHASIS
jgi:hypothetical protein